MKKIVLALTLAVIGTAFLSPVQGFADESTTDMSTSTAVEATEESASEEVAPAAIINSDESSEDLEDSSSSFED